MRKAAEHGCAYDCGRAGAVDTVRQAGEDDVVGSDSSPRVIVVVFLWLFLVLRYTLVYVVEYRNGCYELVRRAAI